MTQTDSAARRKRLLYQAMRRGFREADLLIGGFAAEHIDSLPECELDEFEALLKESDHDLYAWLIGDRPPPAHVAGPLFTKMQAFRVDRHIQGAH